MSATGPCKLLIIGNPMDGARVRSALEAVPSDVVFHHLEEADALGEAAGIKLRAVAPDVMVIGPNVTACLQIARTLRQSSQRTQIVFLLEPKRLEPFRASLPFVPHLGSAWTISTGASSAALQRTLLDAAQAAQAKTNTDMLFGRINLQLASGARSAEARARGSQLALSERYLATLLSQSPDAFLAVDGQGALIAWNEAARKLFPALPDDVRGMSAIELFPRQARPELIRLIDAAHQDQTTIQHEVPLRADGDHVTIHGEISLAPVHDETGRVASVSISVRDVTPRKHAEEQLHLLNETLQQRVAEAIAEREQTEEALRQAQKMESLGQLTGGIAHDFNNMLAVVIGSLDLLGRRIGSSDSRAKRYVDAARDGANRAAALTQRLLAFARQQPLRPEPIDVNRLVAGMSDLLRRSLGTDILIETVLAGGLWKAHADPNQLENTLLNLAVNARDAMPEGGRLTIETQNAFLDERYAANHLGVPAGQYVLIAVTDTGKGMQPDVLNRAFDPFFTTKEIGKGTGLGLSQVYGFVKQTGGHVKIYSEVDQGTTVKVYLPRLVTSEPETLDNESTVDIPLGEPQETILVVEDEPAVRQFAVDALTELGYRVLEADGARTALRMLDGHPETALLFTDVVMPDMNGRKLADEVRRRRPDLKVLFTTGYTRNAVVHNGVLDPGVELIGKPFTIEELAAKVRAILERADDIRR